MDIALGIHIASGFTALAAGTIVMIMKKGHKPHRLLGKIFFITMIGVVASALFISLTKGNQFLMHMAIFVWYQNYAGWRAIQDKSLKANGLDWAVGFMAAINGVVMVSTFNLVLLVFGALSVFLVLQDINTQLLLRKGKELRKLSWLRKHIGMMVGAYIGTFTAFLVVNINDFEPAWLLWLLPTAVLVPLMRYWTKRYCS
ncbi:MAG: hypothetical protein RL204_209 [Bacteroidota bacterium]|jgi:uncharacterized membrane protein